MNKSHKYSHELFGFTDSCRFAIQTGFWFSFSFEKCIDFFGFADMLGTAVEDDDLPWPSSNDIRLQNCIFNEDLI
jgi:hypothetical protein